MTKKQILAFLTLYAVTRGVIDELKPADELTAEANAMDKVAFDSVMDAVEARVASEGGK